MTPAPGWPDDQRRAPSIGSLLAAQAARATGFSVGPFTIAGQQQTAIFCSPSAGICTVTLTWRLDGGGTIESTKVLFFTSATTFQVVPNQGHYLQSVAFAGGGDITYYIAEANLTPFSSSAAAATVPWAGGYSNEFAMNAATAYRPALDQTCVAHGSCFSLSADPYVQLISAGIYVVYHYFTFGIPADINTAFSGNVIGSFELSPFDAVIDYGTTMYGKFTGDGVHQAAVGGYYKGTIAGTVVLTAAPAVPMKVRPFMSQGTGATQRGQVQQTVTYLGALAS